MKTKPAMSIVLTGLLLAVAGWGAAATAPLQAVGPLAAPAQQATLTPRNWMPIVRGGAGALPAEWSQHARDAQRTSYTPQVVPYPWQWRWA